MITAQNSYRHVVSATALDIDSLDHVSNLVYVRWILDAARAHSAALGWDWDRYEARGEVFVVRRQEIDYLLSVKLGESVVVETFVESWRPASCVRRTVLTCGDDTVARAATTWAYVRRSDGRPQRIPAELQAIFAHGRTPNIDP